jgi:hypothetical protein
VPLGRVGELDDHAVGAPSGKAYANVDSVNPGACRRRPDRVVPNKRSRFVKPPPGRRYTEHDPQPVHT